MRWLFLFAFAGTCTCTLSLFPQKIIPDILPSSLSCKKIIKCDKYHICGTICAPGSLHLPPLQQKALYIQRQLAYTHPFCTAQLPGSHNSAITLADGYGIEDFRFQSLFRYLPYFNSPNNQVHTQDQYLSLTDQLEMGVRFIELDVHWFNDDIRIAHCGGYHSTLLDDLIAALNKVAHLLGWKIQWDSGTIGCKPSLSSIPASEERKLETALIEIATWMKRPDRKDEFVTIFFDDESSLDKWHKVSKLLEYITTHFEKEWILPAQNNNSTVFSNTSLSVLMETGVRMVFLTGTAYDDIGPSILFHKNDICHWSEPHLPLSDFPECHFLNQSASKHRRLTRPFSSEIMYGPLNADGHFGPNTNLLNEQTLPHVMECGANIPSPDNLTPERMAAMVWSFDLTKEIDLTICTALNVTSRKWESRPCERMGTPACWTSSGMWVLGTKKVVEKEAQSVCPEGSTYSAPTDGYSNRMLLESMTLTSGNFIWLNLHTLSNQPSAVVEMPPALSSQRTAVVAMQPVALQ